MNAGSSWYFSLAIAVPFRKQTMFSEHNKTEQDGFKPRYNFIITNRIVNAFGGVIDKFFTRDLFRSD